MRPKNLDALITLPYIFGHRRRWNVLRTTFDRLIRQMDARGDELLSFELGKVNKDLLIVRWLRTEHSLGSSQRVEKSCSIEIYDSLSSYEQDVELERLEKAICAI